MNLDHDFAQVWKFSEDQKKNANRTLFSPNSGEDQKKKKKKGLQQDRTLFSPILGEDKKKRSSARIEHFFPKFTLSCTPIQSIGGNADVYHSQTIEGDISPPGFGTPKYDMNNFNRAFSKCWFRNFDLVLARDRAWPAL